jgi:hypothetical protein
VIGPARRARRGARADNGCINLVYGRARYGVWRGVAMLAAATTIGHFVIMLGLPKLAADCHEK